MGLKLQGDDALILQKFWRQLEGLLVKLPSLVVLQS